MSDARPRVIALLALGVVALAVEGVPALAVLGLAGLGLALAQPRARGWRIAIAGSAALLAWSTIVSQAIFYAGVPRTPVEVLGACVYVEGAVHGAAQSLRFLALLGAGLALALSTSADRLATALSRLGVPPAMALVATAALRSAPVVIEEWRAVRAARARRGRPAWRRSPWAWLHLEASLARPVAARALRRARVLGESLDARGFDPAAPAVEVSAGAGRWAWAGAGLAVAVAASTTAARMAFLAYASGLYYAPELRPLYGWVRDWM